MLLKCSTVYDYIKYDKEYLPTDVMEKNLITAVFEIHENYLWTGSILIQQHQ